MEPKGALEAAKEAPRGDEHANLGVIWVILGVVGRLLRPLGTLLGPLGWILGGSWKYFEGILVLFGSYFGGWEASLKRFVEILKNHEKTCKVLQKSRFGGSHIR